VIEPGTAERGHEEVVAQHVLLGDRPEPERLGGIAVVPHDQTARIAPCGELVVAPRVDLHLVLVEAVHEVARDHAVRQRLAFGVDEMERPVAQAVDLLFRDRIAFAVHFLRLRHEPAPDLRQRGQRRAPVAIELHVARGRHRRERIPDPGIVAPEIGEAAVFGVDHHDIAHFGLQGAVERGIGGGLGRGRMRIEQAAAAERQAGEADAGGEQAAARGVLGTIAVRKMGKIVTRVVVLAHASLLVRRGRRVRSVSHCAGFVAAGSCGNSNSALNAGRETVGRTGDDV
jgi:hypothetical protein